MTLHGLLFDKDGTLFDFEATWGAWTAKLLADLFPGPVGAEVAEVLGFDPGTLRFAAHSPVIAETSEQVASLILPFLPGWEKPALIRHMKTEAAGTALVAPVDLQPLIADFRARGLVLGLATNDDESSARAHLETAGIAGSFGFVAGYDSGWGGKPAPGQVQAFLDWSGLAPGSVAMVGDSLHDLHAGRAAGCRTVGVLTGPATAEALAGEADVVLPDIGHLPGWLDSIAAEG
ncbi:HAD family hydrolase [Frigidibacter sp. ROC022]|uniref:HAD family hydrolase n=1 Tax=Frigidibacter sp. ROC022 TaxID=2971796 RepID=UPI00215B2056|nr:HAD family hydrolase [Frigidibacter sp. ROC022]MCR8725454.1 HAD family hydrolase [Frigidibacter sp. ROC022]